ncbi:MAG: hypothetical protein JNL34_02225 [Anaerolineae bacterium]|nr:hypothetical protein [Anaerolineae bacterium]
MATPAQPIPPAAPRSRKRRVACATLIVLWFALLLVPCGLFYFAVQQEVTIPLGSMPGQELRVWLVMEPHTRGIGVSIGQVAFQTDSERCVQTTTTYFLWAGRPENATYCECYVRSEPDQPWSYVGNAQGTCPAGPSA